MFRTILVRALLFLPMAAFPATAQGTTHLNVPAKQIVSILFYKAAGDGYGQMSGIQMLRADSTVAGYAVPAGQALIIRELSVQTNYGTSVNPFQVSVQLSQTDASNQWYYGNIRDSFTIPAGNYSFNFHLHTDAGLVVAGTLKPKVSVAPNNGPFAVSTWDSISVTGWGYLTTF